MTLGRMFDDAGNTINPATSERQDTCITKLTSSIDKLTEIIAAQRDGSQKSQIVAVNGETLSTHTDNRGNEVLNMHDSHVHERVFTHYAVNFPGFSAVTTSPTLKDSNVLQLSSVSGLTAGESHIDVNQADVHIHQFRGIVGIDGLQVTIDSPLDVDVQAGSTIKLSDFNMNKTGSASSPVVFIVPVSAGEVLHITTLLIAMVHSGVPDDGKFGGIPALDNGVVFRVSYGSGDHYDTISNWKRNQDMREDMFDVSFSDAAPAGENGTSGRFHLAGSGPVIRLDGDNGDMVEILIQDDLGDLSDYQIKFLGHYE